MVIHCNVGCCSTSKRNIEAFTGTKSSSVLTALEFYAALGNQHGTALIAWRKIVNDNAMGKLCQVLHATHMLHATMCCYLITHMILYSSGYTVAV